MRFPSIKDVATDLTLQKYYITDAHREHPDDTPGIDVRLQVYDNGEWAIRTGDSQYDTDHNGYWGSGFLTRATNCRELAREMIEEAKDHAAQQK